MSKPLVIVESPAKAKTIAGFLGSGYAVESSIGHIRDLPRSAKEVPSAYKAEPWAKRWGVDVDNDFKPLYIVPAEKKPQVTKLKGLLKDASEVYLATDEDREGESIAWHLQEVLSPRVPVRQMVFHEITRAAIEEAVANSRELNRKLVDAQEARRILDRLVGWDLSEVLWKKVMPGLSAGRVQSVATRLVVERERGRMAFRSAGYWDLEGTFEAKGASFGATLASLDGKRLATGKDFEPTTGRLTAAAANNVALLECGEADFPVLQLGVGVVGTLDVGPQEPRKGDRLARRREEHGLVGAGGGPQPQRNPPAPGVGHLGGHAPLPDQVVEPGGVGVDLAGDLLRAAEPVTGGPDSFVGFLGVLHLAGVVPGLLGEVVGAVTLADLGTGGGDGLLRQGQRVGPHVGDVATLVELLRQAHRAVGAVAKLAGRLLLEGGGHERRVGRLLPVA